MNTKLTLNIDKEVIELAKAYAQKNKTSISRIVSSFLKGLEKKELDNIKLTPWVKELMASKSIRITDKQLKNEYVGYLEEKYK